jgi:hypothetical protein
MGPGPLRLLRGDAVLGTIDALAPARAAGWWEGTLAPAPGWAGVAALFAAEAAANRTADRFFDDWQDAWDAAQGPGLALLDATGARHAVSARIEGLTVRVQAR